MKKLAIAALAATLSGAAGAEPSVSSDAGQGVDVGRDTKTTKEKKLNIDQSTGGRSSNTTSKESAKEQFKGQTETDRTGREKRTSAEGKATVDGNAIILQRFIQRYETGDQPRVTAGQMVSRLFGNPPKLFQACRPLTGAVTMLPVWGRVEKSRMGHVDNDHRGFVSKNLMGRTTTAYMAYGYDYKNQWRNIAIDKAISDAAALYGVDFAKEVAPLPRSISVSMGSALDTKSGDYQEHTVQINLPEKIPFAQTDAYYLAATAWLGCQIMANEWIARAAEIADFASPVQSVAALEGRINKAFDQLEADTAAWPALAKAADAVLSKASCAPWIPHVEAYLSNPDKLAIECGSYRRAGEVTYINAYDSTQLI